ncbi:MAG: OmpA family protein [Muribaculaceae bacterium]|nr:OmpA family protein [Muribaculaceae bacterium]
MKKASLIACACALVMGVQGLAAQEAAQEITYVQDPSQGLLLNRMKDNWFITVEGGASFYMAANGIQRDAADRFMPAGSIYGGKWFSPVFGGRFGVNYLGLKGCAVGPDYVGTLTETVKGGKYYKTKYAEIGPVFDLMINLTNWWCGYKPNRVYNATAYVGAGVYFTLTRHYDAAGKSEGFKHTDCEVMTLRAGLINTFKLNKHIDLSIDLRASGLSSLQNEGGKGWNKKGVAFQGYLALTYNFNKTDWTAPVVPVCPEPENCDALRARLAAADARIADLEAQLKDCLSRPVETKIENNGPLATVYYPIGVSRLSRENQRVVKAIAYVMTQNPDKKYVLTGWADNYTGTDNINMRLRKNRAEGVQKLLVRNGVKDSQLTVTTNNGNLSDLGEKCVALDRAVTIEEAK